MGAKPLALPALSAAPVLLLSADRPDQLAAVLDALTQQHAAPLAERRVFLFQDGGHRPDGAPTWSDHVVLANLDLLRARVPHAIPLPSYLHLGAIGTRDRAERFAFAELAAPAAIVLDDTVLPGRRWLSVMDALLDLALADPRVGYVAAGGSERPMPGAGRGRLVPVRRAAGDALTRRHWLRQRPYIEAWLRAAGARPDAAPDVRAIQALFHGWGVAASDASYDTAVAHACVLTGALRLGTVGRFARSLAAAPDDLPGFAAPVVIDAAGIDEAAFRLEVPSEADLAAFAAAAAGF